MDIVWSSVLCLSAIITISQGKEVDLYVGIDEVEWTYKQTDNSDVVFRKAVYQEYTDQSFSNRKPVTSQQGLLGPVLRASVGETLKIHVRNNAKRSFSFYTDGLKTQKNITGSATLGSPVNPGTTLTYIYIVIDNGPRSGSSAGDCVTSLYYSDVNFLQDTNSGLVGMLIVCQPVSAIKAEFDGTCRIIKDLEEFTHVLTLQPSGKDIIYKFQMTGKYPNAKPNVIIRCPALTEGQIEEMVKCMDTEADGTPMIQTMLTKAEQYLSANNINSSSKPKSGSGGNHENTGRKNKEKRKKRKEKQEEEEVKDEKKASMKTADDVIKRIQWDAELPQDEFLVGYIDRFLGIQEKYFTSFSWEDIASVDYSVLAVPKHRIEYFKYKDIKVWDKPRRIDNVFGSTGNPDVAQTTEGIQDTILEHESRFESCCMPLHCLHMTLCTIGLDTPEQVEHCVSVLNRLKPELASMAPKNIPIILKGIGHFFNRALYAKIEGAKELYEFVDHIKLCFKNEGIEIRDNHEFVPHMTIIKVTRPVGNSTGQKYIPPWLYSHKTDVDFGQQVLDNIYLCKMTHERREDGFYVTPAYEKAKSTIFLHFGTFYEEESWYSSANLSASLRQTTFSTINGYTGGNLPDIEVCLDRNVRLHMTSLGGQNDIHTVVLYGHQFEVKSQRFDSLSLYPGAAVQANFRTLEEGTWQLTTQHTSDNLHGRVIVSTCNSSRPAQQLSGNIRYYYIAAEREQGGSTPGPIVFQEYTGPTFKTKKPSNLQINGRLGPLIYAETKDMVKVVFYNRADRNLTLYPHGLRVGKMFEGVLYDDVTGKGAVPPNRIKTYFWSVPEDVSVSLFDDDCLVRHYTSGIGHGDDSFLFGPLKICYDGFSQIVSTEKELFVIHTKTSTDIESINGVPSESLIPGPVCLKERLTFNLMTYGTREPQSFVVGGSVIRQKGHVLNVLAAEENSMSSYKVTFVKTGNWSVRSFRNENVSFIFSVDDCGETIDFVYSSKEYSSFIAIGAGKWSYSKVTDWASKLPRFQMGPAFQKAMFEEYYSNFFLFAKTPPNVADKVLHGPQLYAKVGDKIKLDVNNKEKRQHSLHVDGLSDQTNIAPGGSLQITWEINEAIGPGSADPSCIMKPYYSRTSQRDIPSGLFGPLIICSSTVPNDVVGSNLQQKVFIVGSVDETQSWYLEDNLKTYTGIVDTDDPRFAEANAIRGKCSYITVNGYSDGSMKNMTVPMGEDVYFHFLNVGNDLLTIHVYGLNTSVSPQTRVGLSTVTLYPWDSKSIVTRFDTPGSFQYEELTSQGHTTQIHGFYTVLSNTKTTE
uniref:Ceruloplasmin n=2 Tax=Magallana gigas TaxID=29159 RepID=K1QSH0_MAGGI